MKRILAFLLAFLLAFPSALAEQPAPSDIALPEDDPILSLLPYEGAFLVYTRKGLYQVIPDLPQVQCLVNEEGLGEPLTLLFAQGRQLWGLDAQRQALVPLILQEGQLQRGQALDIHLLSLLEEQLIDPGMAPYPDQALVHQDRLLLRYRQDTPNGYGMTLLSFDLGTGKGRAHTVPGLQVLAQPPDGGLLALTQDTLTAFDPAGRGAGPLSLQRFDPDTDTLGEARPINLSAERPSMLAAAPDTGHIYLATWEKIYRLEKDNSLTFCAHTGFLNDLCPAVGAFLAMPGERALIPVSGQIRQRSLNPDDLSKGRLRIMGEGLGQPMQKAAKALAPAVVENLGMRPYNNATDLAQAFLTGSLETDLLLLESDNFDLDTLKKKGYCLDMSKSPALMAYISRLSPELQTLAMQEDMLMLLPVEMFSSIPAYYPKVFEELGIPVPATFDELLHLLEVWQTEYADQFPDYSPLQSSDPLQELLLLTMGLYSDCCAATGEEFSFQSPALKGIMERLDALFTQNPRAFQSGNPLMELRTNLEPGMVITGMTMDDRLGPLAPMPLSLREDVPPRVSSVAWVWMVTKDAASADLAIAYLEEYIKAMEPFTQAKLFSGFNQEVENPYFADTWKLMQKRLEELNAAAAKAEGAQQSQAQQKAEDYRRNMENFEQKERVLVSIEKLAAYQQLMQNSRLQKFGAPDGFFVFGNSPAIRLMLQYTQKLISLEEMLAECHQRFRLMQMEAGE